MIFILSFPGSEEVSELCLNGFVKFYSAISNWVQIMSHYNGMVQNILIPSHIRETLIITFQSFQKKKFVFNLLL